VSLPAPLQPLYCPNPDCTLETGGRCAREAEHPKPLLTCPDLARQEGPAVQAPLSNPPIPEANAAQGEAPPWHGEALRGSEVMSMLGRSWPIVIAVAGPHDAGKSCYLTALFLQIATGQLKDLPYRFASSRTLLGFQKLAARAGAWLGEGQILDHTPKVGDEGTFLHLGLRPSSPDDHRHLDVLLSDFPGEWIENFALAPEQEVRARFLTRAAAVLVLADAEKMATRSYEARIARLLNRLEEQGKRTAVLFTKIDQVPITAPTDPMSDAAAWGVVGQARRTWEVIQRLRSAHLWGAVFGVASFPQPVNQGQPIGVMAPFKAVLDKADERKPFRPAAPPIPEGAVGFLTMRTPEKAV
jgi:hypothetical protein